MVGRAEVIHAERGTKPACVTSTSAGRRVTVVWKVPTDAPVPVSVTLASMLTDDITGGVVGLVGESTLGELGELPPHAAAAESDSTARHSSHRCTDARIVSTVAPACIGEALGELARMSG